MYFFLSSLSLFLATGNGGAAASQVPEVGRGAEEESRRARSRQGHQGEKDGPQQKGGQGKQASKKKPNKQTPIIETETTLHTGGGRGGALSLCFVSYSIDSIINI